MADRHKGGSMVIRSFDALRTAMQGSAPMHLAVAGGDDPSVMAGVVAAFLRQPLGDLAEKAINGKFLEADPATQERFWQPESPTAEQFAGVALGAEEKDEAGYFLRAAKGL